MNINEIVANSALQDVYKNFYSAQINKQNKQSENNTIKGIDSEELLKKINKTTESEDTEQSVEKTNTEETVKSYEVPENEKTEYEKLVGTLINLQA